MNMMRATALHESSHAIIAEALGRIVVSVALDGPNGNVHTLGLRKDTLSEIENELTICMAGPIGEHILAGTPLDCEDFDGDRENQARLASILSAMGEDASVYLEACEATATALVFAKRKDIEALAKRLLMREVA